MQRIQELYGPISKVWIGPKNMYVLIADPDFVEFLLSSPKFITKSIDYDGFKVWLGRGLLVATGSYWHKKRKMLTPAFHFNILEEFYPIFNSVGEILLKNLSKKVGTGPFDIYPFITAYSLDTICETAMSASVNAQSTSNNPYVQAVEDMRNVFIRRVFSPWKIFQTLFEYSEDYRIQTKALSILHGFSRSVIEKRKKMKENEIEVNTELVDEVGRKKRIAFLDLLLESKIDGRSLTEEEIREEVDTFMFEGHDTTSSAIGFALHELANNPHIQDKVGKELEDIFGVDKKRSVTYQDIQSMKYLELVVKEILRMYPSVPMMGRQLIEDTEYKGTIYPAGLNIVVFTYGIQRRADLFSDPNTFNPDRFLTENHNKKSSYTYIPFSAGPRNCIGQKFALLEMKAILAKILLNFELVSTGTNYPLTKLSGEVILKSEEGIILSLKNRC